MSRKRADKSVYEGFGARLSSAVKDKNAFAKAVGVSYETVRVWCNGEFLPNPPQLLKINEILGVSIDWLLTGKGNGITDPDLEAAREILSCGDEAIIRSFRERLRDYGIAIARKRELDYLKCRLAELEKKVESLLPGGDAPGREEAGGPAASRKKAM